jgi:phosphoribosylamine--glycine ligase/phosphoribosylformylglycinamidine cyclo-ligase
MNVLIIGSGGREHALAWKIARSPRLGRLFIAPGNAGTLQQGHNVPIPAQGAARELVEFCQGEQIDLVVIGPEAPLAEGLADDLRLAGLAVFGPSRSAAQIEASKAFSKAFMARHAIPTARFAVFNDYQSALAHLEGLDYPVVIKASGLAAGKGVILPEDRQAGQAALYRLMVAGEFGAAGAEVVIEERLQGEEVSLLAFCDGTSLKVMPPAQDHKRLLNGDAGPNTGGMGAYAPAPVCPPALVEQAVQTILQPALDGLREEGMPFVGVLYAGLMLTSHGPRVLEFNCRFGDPETQAILPLLETDLLTILEACVQGNLQSLVLHWKPGAAACVVLASGGYPEKVTSGQLVSGLEKTFEDAVIFHAGTRLVDRQVLTAGGRVLGVTGWGASLPEALERAYAAVTKIAFEGMQYRNDIGSRALGRQSEPPGQSEAPSAYAAAGVSIDAGNRAVDLMRAAVQSTYGPQVLAGIGAFGGLFDGAGLKQLQQPVLVASIDGVGTKVELAARLGRYAGLGQDIVNHCINDILVQGARPLFFLDYFATARLEPQVAAEIVGGMALACRQSGCALLGGETAEMPGVYADGQFDVAGCIVGFVERGLVLPRPNLQPGDVLLGLPSSGPHTNGYSLIRKLAAGLDLDAIRIAPDVSLAEALLAPHRSYLNLLLPILEQFPDGINALVHITGGGFIENIPRILPEGLSAIIECGSWPIPPVFRWLQERGKISDIEMYRVFNMGIGMVVIAAAKHAATLQGLLPEMTYQIGKLAAGKRKVVLQ